jgi:membrane carboxypeptidase/penicillin-binding protein
MAWPFEEHHHRATDASVGPARVARLARAMGVRQSKLEPVPSLALGTSPVTLKEMVSRLRHHRQRPAT